MGTVPTSRMETELRKLYLKWVKELPEDFDVEEYLQDYISKSVSIIERMGGEISRLGVSQDFPAPKLLDLATWPTRIYSDLEVAAIRAGIATGLNARETARAMFQAGISDARWKLERLARTETVNAYWRNQRAEAADLGLVLLWSSETTARTCNWCKERDGMVAEDGCRDHPNGRCTLVPTLPSRVNYKGSVKADGTIYWDDDWDKAFRPSQESLSPFVPRDISDFDEDWPELDINGTVSRVDSVSSVDKAMGQSLSDSEREAISKYASGEYFFDIKDAYMKGDTYLLSDGTDLFSALEAALSKSTLKNDTKLFRAMQVDSSWIDSLVEGSTIDHKFFISTTTSHAEATTYGVTKKVRGQKPVILQILAPAGTHASPGMTAIQEVILSPETRMRVRSVKPLSKQTLVTVDIV